jgi:predicted phosphodiesterase
MPRFGRPAIIVFGVVIVFVIAITLGRGPHPIPDATGQPPPVAPPPDPTKFVVAPYLQFPTQNSIIVMWETASAGTSVVEYGLTPAEMKKIQKKSDGTMHDVKIEGLATETRYVYRVSSTLEDGTALAGPLSQFMTAVKDDSAFSFAVIGDTQKNPKMTAKIAKVMSDRRPHFVMHCGDVVDNGADKAEWVNELFGPCADLFSRTPIFPTIGNHEKNHANYYRYFNLPEPEYRYRYHYGNADFFVVDSNKTLKPDSEQFKWLDEELGRSTATWKFVYHHHPVWSSDADDYGDTKKGVFRLGDLNARSLATLYEKHKIDVAFNGHIHAYERTWPIREGKVNRKNGVVYVTSGGGGGRLEDFSPLPNWFKAQLRSDFHCCYVNIQAGKLEFKAFDQNGQLFDQFEFEK